MLNILTRQTIDEMQAHAMEAFPNIAVGIVSGWIYYKLAIIPAPEIDKEDNWQISYKNELYNHKLNNGVLRFVVFSRPRMVAYPNEREMVAQLASDAPWIYLRTDGVDCEDPVIWGKGSPLWAYIGRPFRHGVMDCYSLIRDYYKLEYKLFLDEYPRDWFWWDSKSDYLSAMRPPVKDLYGENFSKQGFTPIANTTDLKQGDSVLMKLNSDSINHAAIYIGDGKILHHVSSMMPIDYKRVSKIDNYSLWARRFEVIPVRHFSINQE